MLRLADYIHRQWPIRPPPSRGRRGTRRVTGRPGRRSRRVAVNPGNLNECRIAIDEFGELQIGIALPVTRRARRNGPSSATARPIHTASPAHGAATHPLPRVRRRDVQVRHVGRGNAADRPIPHGLRTKAHVVVTQELLSKDGIGPGGGNWDELIADIKALPRQQDKGRPSGGASEKPRLSEAYSLAPPRVSLPGPGYIRGLRGVRGGARRCASPLLCSLRCASLPIAYHLRRRDV